MSSYITLHYLILIKQKRQQFQLLVWLYVIIATIGHGGLPTRRAGLVFFVSDARATRREGRRACLLRLRGMSYVEQQKDLIIFTLDANHRLNKKAGGMIVFVSEACSILRRRATLMRLLGPPFFGTPSPWLGKKGAPEPRGTETQPKVARHYLSKYILV